MSTDGSCRQLLLLRHAKAVPALPGMTEAFDHARALSERGRADASAMGALLRERKLIAERALVSTSARTRETFDLLGPFEAGAPELVLSDALYLAEPRTLLDTLCERSADARSVLLIGHNPGLHELAMMLATDSAALDRSFPTCMLALFRITGNWQELRPGQATLLELLRP
jgi:phosphohistidine phosphatase